MIKIIKKLWEIDKVMFISETLILLGILGAFIFNFVQLITAFNFLSLFWVMIFLGILIVVVRGFYVRIKMIKEHEQKDEDVIKVVEEKLKNLLKENQTKLKYAG